MHPGLFERSDSITDNGVTLARNKRVPSRCHSIAPGQCIRSGIFSPTIARCSSAVPSQNVTRWRGGSPRLSVGRVWSVELQPHRDVPLHFTSFIFPEDVKLRGNISSARAKVRQTKRTCSTSRPSNTIGMHNCHVSVQCMANHYGEWILSCRRHI